MIGFSISWKLFLEIRVKSGSLVWDCRGRGRDLVECVLFIRLFELVGGYDLFALVVVRFSMFSSLSESISEIERRRFCAIRCPIGVNNHRLFLPNGGEVLRGLDFSFWLFLR